MRLCRDAAEGALEVALDELCVDVEQAVRDGVNLVVLTDRTAEGEVPIPSLLSLAAVHNHLIAVGLRTDADLIVETGDAMRAHDFACLVGYSASGIYPYAAHECIRDLCERGEISIPGDEAVANYDRAVVAGITSIMSKMGISTMQGYHSAQIFEILGLDDSLVEKYFTHTSTRIGGLDAAGVQRELNERYDSALALEKSPSPEQLHARRHRVASVWRRGAPDQPANHLPAATRLPRGRLRPVPRVQRRVPRARARGHAARSHGLRADAPAGAAGRG